MSHTEVKVGQRQTFVFDYVVTNAGGNYNRHTGILVFTSPDHGVYVFSWTLYCQLDGFLVSEVVANSNSIGSVYCSAISASAIRHVTGVVVVEINQGDVVFVRSHPIATNDEGVHSSDIVRSSFSGWKLF